MHRNKPPNQRRDACAKPGGGSQPRPPQTHLAGENRRPAGPAGGGGGGNPQSLSDRDRELYLENYKGILAYGKEEIHVNGGPWVLRILGRDLEIKAMRAGEMRITGWVDRLELL